LAANLGIGIDLLRRLYRDLVNRVFDLLRRLDHALHRVCPDLPRVLVQFGAKVLLRLVEFARCDDDGVLDSVHYNLRIDALLAADRVNRVIELTCHKTVLSIQLSAFSHSTSYSDEVPESRHTGLQADGSTVRQSSQPRHHRMLTTSFLKLRHQVRFRYVVECDLDFRSGN